MVAHLPHAPIIINQPKRRYRIHEIVTVEPAVKATVKHRGLPLGWGTAAGIEARCSCGFHTRDSEDMAYHIGSQNTRLEAADPLGYRPLKHRMVAGLRLRKSGYMAYCACGFGTNSIKDLAAHIETENWCAANAGGWCANAETE